MLKLKKCNEVMLPKSLIDGYLVHHRQLLWVWRMENGRRPWGRPQALVLVLPSATSARVPQSEPTAPASECPSSEPTSLSDVRDSSAPLRAISLLWGQRAKLSPTTFLSLSSTVFGRGRSLSFPSCQASWPQGALLPFLAETNSAFFSKISVLGVQLISNVIALLSGRVIQLYVYSISHSFPSRLWQDTEESSLCYAVGLCYLSILYVRFCTGWFQMPSPTLPLKSSLATTNHSSRSVSLFLCHGQVQLYYILDSRNAIFFTETSPC